MTSRLRSRIEYLIVTDNTLVLLLLSNLIILESSCIDEFQFKFDNSEVAYFLLGRPVHASRQVALVFRYTVGPSCSVQPICCGYISC